MKYNIIKVETRRDLKRFISFHYDLYRGSRYDAPTLFEDEWRTLSKDKNAAFDFSEADYFMVTTEKGKVLGRIAAIINHKANDRWQRKAVRFGWVDFVDDKEVSRLLFEKVEQWGRERGMREIVGPLGFTDLDPEGMLTWGFDELGTMSTIYNHDYYPRHMEALGYGKDTGYVEMKLFVPKEVPEKYSKISDMIARRYNLHVIKPTRKDILQKHYGQKIFDLVNLCYKDIYGYSELSQRQIDQYIAMYMPVLDLDLVTLIEDWTEADHKLIGLGISMPSLSRALQHCRRGRLLPFGWWHLLRALKWGKTKYVDLHLVGILPEYRKKGANALLFSDLIPRYAKRGYLWGETQVELEDNNNVQSQWQALESQLHKRRCTFKKEI